MKDSDEIINSIKSGKAKMHSHAYFVAQAVFVILGAILLFLVILFSSTFILFALQQNGGLFAANFGPAGWSVFLQSFPWSILLLSLALVLVLWILLRRYAVIYHQPFLYVLLILVIVIALACLFISAGSIHGGIFQYASRNRIPMVSGFYEFETAPPGGIYRGQVIAIASSSFVLQDILGDTSTVILAQRIPGELIGVNQGDYVIVFGRPVATATIAASGVETIVDYQ